MRLVLYGSRWIVDLSIENVSLGNCVDIFFLVFVFGYVWKCSGVHGCVCLYKVRPIRRFPNARGAQPELNPKSSGSVGFRAEWVWVGNLFASLGRVWTGVRLGGPFRPLMQVFGAYGCVLGAHWCVLGSLLKESTPISESTHLHFIAIINAQSWLVHSVKCVLNARSRRVFFGYFSSNFRF